VQEVTCLTPGRAHLHNSCGQVVHTLVPLSAGNKFSTSQWVVVMLSGWEGDHSFDTILAVCYKLKWSKHPWAEGLGKGFHD